MDDRSTKLLWVGILFAVAFCLGLAVLVVVFF